MKFVGNLWSVAAKFVGSLVLFLILMVMLFGNLGNQASQAKLSEKVVRPGDKNEKVAIVNLNGVIVADAPSDDPFTLTSGFVSARKINEILAELAKDDSVKAIMLEINSPGGSVVGSDEISRKVLEVRETKPVVAQMGEIAASGGYYLASAANKIVASPATLTGSIGTIMQVPEFSGLYDKLGIRFQTIKAGKLKDMGASDRELIQEERDVLQALANEAQEQFLAAIVQGRRMEEGELRELADGRIYSGKQAKDNGLVDELGSFESAIDYTAALAQLKNPQVVEYSKDSFLDTLLQASANTSPFSFLFSEFVPEQQFGVYYVANF